MDIFVDNEKIFSLSQDEIKILQYSIPTAQYVADIKRRLEWVIRDQHLGGRSRELRAEWEPKLIARGATTLPVDAVAFSKLAMAESDYQDASARLLAAQQIRS